jgi:hypothetical protein
VEEEYSEPIMARARMDALVLCARFPPATLYYLMREDALLYYRMVGLRQAVEHPEHDPRYYLHRALAIRDYLDAPHDPQTTAS